MVLWDYLRNSLRVGFQVFLEDGQGLCSPSFRGKLLPPVGCQDREEMDWAEKELPFRRGGMAKRTEVAEWDAWVGV